MRKPRPQMWLLSTLILLVCLSVPFPAFAAFEQVCCPAPIHEKYEIAINTDYMSIMQELCMSGDTAAGEETERLRNLKIDLLGLTEPKIAFQDLYLLSKLIASEAGSSWLSVDWKMAVGEVLLNRVSSPEFPDTIEACVYAPGQYYNVITGAFYSILPDYDCVIAAKRLLYGERVLNDSSVVFQSNFQQGEVFQVLHDDYLGDTYLCKSSRTELYTQ